MHYIKRPAPNAPKILGLFENLTTWARNLGVVPKFSGLWTICVWRWRECGQISGTGCWGCGPGHSGWYSREMRWLYYRPISLEDPENALNDQELSRGLSGIIRSGSGQYNWEIWPNNLEKRRKNHGKTAEKSRKKLEKLPEIGAGIASLGLRVWGRFCIRETSQPWPRNHTISGENHRIECRFPGKICLSSQHHSIQ